MDEVAGLRGAVHRDPRGVDAEAGRLVEQARTSRDDELLSRALAVRGRARRSLGEIDRAEHDLQDALDVATRLWAQDPRRHGDLVADARIGLAGVLSFAGRTEEALAHLDDADRVGSDDVRAYGSLQRAIIDQRVGRTREALARYTAALPVLRRRADANVDVALVLLNRGVLRTYAGETAAAVDDLQEAAARFAAESHDFGVAQARHGLGWALARRGDFPRALAQLGEAAERFRALGHEALEVDQDRIEAMLAAGLSVDALTIGASTGRRLAALGNHSLAAEVWLLCARAAVLEGDPETATSFGERARALFAGQGAAAWERAARLEVVRATTGPGDPAELRALAAALDDAGNARGVVTASALAAIASAEQGDVDEAAAALARCRRQVRRLGTVELRVLTAHASTACALARGDRRGALRQLRSGLDDLHRHRATVAAGDAAAAMSLHGRRLAELGLRLTLARRSPALLLAWMERVRAGRGRHLPTRPPVDDTAAHNLEELRAVVAQVRRREAAREDVADLLQRQAELESAIRLRLLELAGTPATSQGDAPTVGRLRALLGDRLLVELADVDGCLVGTAVDRRGARLVDLGDSAGIVSTAAAVSALLGRHLTRGSDAGPGAASGAGQRIGRALAALDSLVAPALRGGGGVVLVLPPALHTVPWALLPSLRGRAVVVTPSARWWVLAESTPQHPREGPVVAVAGPRLREAEPEAQSVAAQHPQGRVLRGPGATTAAVLDVLGTAPVVHVASHGRIRHDNPLWSSLELADGPLYVHDLERVPSTPPTVVLSGCDTGAGVRAGDELLGLSTALLDRGTRHLVAAVTPLPDSPATRTLMTALHQRLSSGAGSAAALCGLVASDDPELSLLAGSLTAFGS